MDFFSFSIGNDIAFRSPPLLPTVLAYRAFALITSCDYAFNMEGLNTDSEVITIDSDSDDLEVTHYVKSTPTTATSMYYTLRKRD